MKMIAVENALHEFKKRVEQMEQCGLDRSDLYHDCRSLLSTMTTFQGQVQRAIALLRENKRPEALTELGDDLRTDVAGTPV